MPLVTGRNHITDIQINSADMTLKILCKCPEPDHRNRLVTTAVIVPEEGFHKWLKGDLLIQDAFPALTVEQREYLMTGYCVACQRAIFGGDDDDEY